MTSFVGGSFGGDYVRYVYACRTPPGTATGGLAAVCGLPSLHRFAAESVGDGIAGLGGRPQQIANPAG
jgi:hypothetical protein